MVCAGRMRIALVSVTALVLAPAAAALGHSVVERSDPPPNASLAAMPRRIALRFNEPVDPVFTTVVARDQAGRQVSGQTTVGADGLVVTVPLVDVAPGVIAVRWRALSAVDGHTSAGLFVFTVGRAPPGAGATAVIFAPSLTRLALRWIVYLAAIFLAGRVAFQALVLEPGLRAWPPDDAVLLKAAARRALGRATVWAAAVLAGAVALDVGLQLAELATGPLPAVRGIFGAFLFGTRPGWGAMVQAGMAGLLLVPRSPRGRILQAAAVVWIILTVGLMTTLGGPAAVVGSTHAALLVLASSVYGLLGIWMAFILPQVRDIPIPPLTGVPLAAGAGLLLGLALRSHGAGNGLVALLGDWLHLLAAALWIGGLAALWIALRSAPEGQRPLLARALVPRVSRLAGAGLLAMVATGAYAAWLNVATPRALLTTAYGRVLLLKLLLVAIIAGLGAYNRFVLRPAIAADPRPVTATRRFRRSITVEAALGAGVLLAVAALTIMPPAKVTYRAERPAPTVMSGLAGDLRARIAITPLSQGGDRFEVEVAGSRAPVAADEAFVRVRLTKLDEDLEPVTMTLAPRSGGRYATEGGYLLLDGWWEVGVFVRRRGREDVSATFPLRRGHGRTAGRDAEADRLLARARAASAALRSWHEDEQAGDERGVVVTGTDFQPPRRLRYQTSTGVEGIVIGQARYVRSGGGPWARDARAPARSFDGAFASLAGARRAALGRRAACPEEACQIVLWDGSDGATMFAGWIGMPSGRLRRLLVIERGQYRTIEVSGFDAPVHIDAPR